MFKVGDLVLVEWLELYNAITLEKVSKPLYAKGYIVNIIPPDICGVSLIDSNTNILVPSKSLKKIEY